MKLWFVITVLVHFGLSSEYVARHFTSKLIRHLAYIGSHVRLMVLRVAGLLPRSLEARLIQYADTIQNHLENPDLTRAAIEHGLQGTVCSIHFLTNTIRYDRMSLVFACLFVFRYLRLVVHLFSFWFMYQATPVPSNPTLSRSDCTIILPTVDPTNADFSECITSCLRNKPGAIIIVTVGEKLAKITKEVVDPICTRYPKTAIKITTTDVANKRLQVAHGLQYVKTKITILLDDHVFWPSPRFLPTLLAPFEDPQVGIVGTNKRVRRTDLGFNMRSFWNMLGALYLERHNFEIRATNAIDGGVFVISGRTSAHRSQILKDPEFMQGFTNERFFFGLFGPLNADDDNFITRWNVRHGYKIKIQYCPDALIETTLGTYPKFLSQCLRWVRTTWRSNSASLFTDRTVWWRQPWCVYAVYWTSFFNFALFYDAALVYTLAVSRLGTRTGLTYLAAWIFFTKMVKLTPYFLRRPQDLIMLPGYFAFAYFHSLVKLYAGLTFWETNWGGRNLDDITKGGKPPAPGNDDNSSDESDGGVRLAPVPKSIKSTRVQQENDSDSDSGGGVSLAPAPAPARAPAPVHVPAPVAAPTPVPPTPQRRGRGRPRKNPLPDSPQVVSQAKPTAKKQRDSGPATRALRTR